MVAYTFKALTGANLSQDQGTFTLTMETEQGPISLSMNRAQMDHFAITIEGIEQRTMMLDRAKEAGQREVLEMRFLLADNHQVGTVNANGVPAVALVLKAGASVRAYALKRDLAEGMAKAIANQIPKLGPAKAG